MRLAIKTFALAAASSALLIHPAAAANAISGDLNIVANAYTHSLPTVTDQQTQTWSGAPTTLNVAADAEAKGGIYRDHNETVSAFGTAQATWASANSGAVNFTNYGWDFNVKDDDPTLASGADLDQNRPGNDWTYTFQATGNGVFSMNYDVSASGSTFGLYGWEVLFNGVSVGPDLTGNQFSDDPTTSGVVTEALVAGQFYTVALDGNPNLAACCSRMFSGSMDGTFNWDITERSGGVPEPASWALMLAGFGGLGAMLRARRRVATAPGAAA